MPNKMKNQPQVEEKRKFVRLNALTDIVYEKHPVKGKDKLQLAKNISGAGICLIAYDEVKKSDFLDLKVFLPDRKAPVQAIGKVAWVQEFTIGDYAKGKRYDVGVEFVKIKDTDKDAISKYIFSHLTPP